MQTAMESLDGLIAMHHIFSAVRAERFEEMKRHTMEWGNKFVMLTNEQIKLHCVTIDGIFSDIARYDIAAIRWADTENMTWADSEAASIAAGILIKLNEIY